MGWLIKVLIGCMLCFSGTDTWANLHIKVTGYVKTTEGQPMGGVQVTDGTTIVTTNKKGYYYLETTTASLFVYITLPAGFEIPVNNNMALFYKKIEPVKGLFKADFTLQKMARSDNRHFMILWADPQINNLEEAAQLLGTAVPDTRLLAAELNTMGPVHGIAAGDLSWDAPPIIPSYKEAVRQSGIPFFQVLGNHDMDIHVRSDEQSDSTFRKSMGPTWYAFNRGKAHYIVLDNVFYYSDGYNYMGYITEQQFRWLEQDLLAVEPGAPVFVSMHISAYTNEKERNKAAADNLGDITVNRRFLFELLKPFNAHLVTGHTHYNENIVSGSIFQHIHAAVCGTWWVHPLCGDGTPRGYGVYEVDGNNVQWYYKSVGHPRQYQMRTYNRGAYKDHPADIAVNVWNWDEAWQVNWYEDGVLKGAMEQRVAYDAAVVEALTGANKPVKYPWAAPLLTNHLFFARPSATARQIKIEVTDRFGNVYTEVFDVN